jgi:putative restriction endonuclease
VNRDAILEQFVRLNVWRRKDQRAPHKPLLILYALGRWARGNTSAIPFREVDRDLTALLKEFGPPRQSYHPEYPFWRLQNDGVWVVQATGIMKARQSNTDPPRSELLTHEACGAFADEVQAALASDPALVTDIAGLTLGTPVKLTTRRGRDPQFRQRVLTAYEWRCAVCGFDVRLGSVSVGLDAAHILWHQAGGPDREGNGLALCVLHHKLFDLGAFTVNADGRLLVSDQANGTEGFQEALLRHHGRPVRQAQRPEWCPEAGFLKWHLHEVFKGAARHVG